MVTHVPVLSYHTMALGQLIRHDLGLVAVETCVHDSLWHTRDHVSNLQTNGSRRALSEDDWSLGRVCR